MAGERMTEEPEDRLYSFATETEPFSVQLGPFVYVVYSISAEALRSPGLWDPDTLVARTVSINGALHKVAAIESSGPRSEEHPYSGWWSALVRHHISLEDDGPVVST